MYCDAYDVLRCTTMYDDVLRCVRCTKMDYDVLLGGGGVGGRGMGNLARNMTVDQSESVSI